jgi:hypothetical protein
MVVRFGMTPELGQVAYERETGTFFDLPGRDLYTVKLTVARTGGNRPVAVDFKYDHRRK